MPVHPSTNIKVPNIYNPKSRANESILDYKKTVDIVEKVKKAFGKKGHFETKNDQMVWEDLLEFMKRNPHVLMQMLPDG